MTGVFSKPPDEAAIRTFVAVELSPDLRATLSALASEFAAHRSSIKWTSEDLLHITVRFLGNVPAHYLGDIIEAAEASARQVQPFHLGLSGLGAFPGLRSPRVIWAGLRADAGRAVLERLFSALERELVQRRFQPEGRAFSPHITLGRVREGTTPTERRQIGEVLSRILAQHPMNGTMAVSDLVVMRSDLRRTGPVYTVIARAALG